MTAEHVLAQMQLENKIEQLLLQSGVVQAVIDQLPQVRRLTTGVPAPLISRQALTSIEGDVVPNALEKRLLTRDVVVPGTDASYVTYMEDPNAPGSPLVANLVDEVITDEGTRRQLFGRTTRGGVKPGNEHVAEVALKAATGQPVTFEPNGEGHVDLAGMIDGRMQSIDAQVRPMRDQEKGTLRNQLVTKGGVPGMSDPRDMSRALNQDMRVFIERNDGEVSPDTVVRAMAFNGKLNDNWDDKYHIGKAYKYDNVMYSTVPFETAIKNEKRLGHPLAQAYDELHMLQSPLSYAHRPIGNVNRIFASPNSGAYGNQMDRIKIEMRVPEKRAIDMVNTPRYAGASQLLRTLPYA